MPRQKRVDEANGVYHALSHGNARQAIFHKEEDYEAFLRVIGEGLGKHPVGWVSYCLMPNHWHLVVRPQKDAVMGRFLRWVTATHTQRYHAHYQTAGEGPLYQSRFKSFPIQEGPYDGLSAKQFSRDRSEQLAQNVLLRSPIIDRKEIEMVATQQHVH